MGKFLRAVRKTARAIDKMNRQIERGELKANKANAREAKSLLADLKRQTKVYEKESAKTRKELFEKYKTVHIRLKVDESYDWAS